MLQRLRMRRAKDVTRFRQHMRSGTYPGRAVRARGSLRLCGKRPGQAGWAGRVAADIGGGRLKKKRANSAGKNQLEKQTTTVAQAVCCVVRLTPASHVWQEVCWNLSWKNCRRQITTMVSSGMVRIQRRSNDACGLVRWEMWCVTYPGAARRAEERARAGLCESRSALVAAGDAGQVRRLSDLAQVARRQSVFVRIAAARAGQAGAHRARRLVETRTTLDALSRAGRIGDGTRRAVLARRLSRLQLESS
jgi:hypothetical protein